MLQEGSTGLRLDWFEKLRQGCAAHFYRVSFVLLVAGVTSIPWASAQQPAKVATAEAPPVLEVASIKPSKPDDRGRKLHTLADRITIENFTLKELIAYAYDLEDNSQVLGGPDWLGKTHFDIEGIAGEAEAAKLRSMSADDQRKEWGVILQPFLAERFRLKVSLGERTMPIYALVIAKSGPKLKAATVGEKGQSTSWNNQRMTWTATSMDNLAYYLTRVEGRVVMNRTGLTGAYDFTLEWSWEENTSSEAYAADLLTALREQLGLELKADKGPVNVAAVDGAAMPEFD
jgi:uncharacterized protein (TIGR03435 family)